MPLEMQLTPLLLIYSISTVLTVSLVGYGSIQLRRRGWDDTVAAFVGIVLGVSIWSGARFFELLFVDQTVTRFWLANIYIGWGIAGVSVLLFGLAYTDRNHWLKRRYVAGLFVLPTLAVVLAATNSTHELLWTGEFVYSTGWWGEVTVFDRSFEPTFYAYMVYTVACVFGGLYVLLRMAVGSPDVYRRQVLAFSVGSFVGVTSGVLFGLEAQPFVPSFIDLTPVGFGVLGLCFGYAIFQHRMLDLVPVARDTVIESMRDGYLVLDTDGRIVDLNNAAREVLAEDDQVIGETLATALPEASGAIENHEHGTRTEEEFEVEIRGEQRFLVTIVSSLYEDDRLIGRLVLMRDVTERRTIQRRFQALIENSSDLILVVDEAGKITYGSPSLSHISGVDPEEIVGRDAFSFIHEDDRGEFEALFEDLLDHPAEKRRQEYRTWDATGELLYMEASVWNLLDNPFVEGIVVNAREITERKRREQEIEQKNRDLERANTQLEQFARVISHDLRNPINVAKGHLELARDNGHTESFETIDDSLERMESIIDDVLTLAREGESIGETEKVEVAEIATEAWGHVDTDEAELVIATDGSFEADPDRILQLLENLFRNAHEHVGHDVEVTVGISDTTFYVEDDGPGIPDEAKPKILEYGHSTNEDGTGLGLSIVDQIATAHGWDVAVTDGERGGARFEFRGVETA